MRAAMKMPAGKRRDGARDLRSLLLNFQSVIPSKAFLAPS